MEGDLDRMLVRGKMVEAQAPKIKRMERLRTENTFRQL